LDVKTSTASDFRGLRADSRPQPPKIIDRLRESSRDHRDDDAQMRKKRGISKAREQHRTRHLSDAPSSWISPWWRSRERWWSN